MFRRKSKKNKYFIATFLITVLLALATPFISAQNVLAHQCGTGEQKVTTSINFGCRGEECLTNPTEAICQGGDHTVNGIIDLLFALIRFLSIGVGMVIIASIIVAGIQFTTSSGNPQTTANALNRIRDTAIALLIFIFAYAIINWLVPGQLLK